MHLQLLMDNMDNSSRMHLQLLMDSSIRMHLQYL
jgi:hypothetical protein